MGHSHSHSSSRSTGSDHGSPRSTNPARERLLSSVGGVGSGSPGTGESARRLLGSVQDQQQVIPQGAPGQNVPRVLEHIQSSKEFLSEKLGVPIDENRAHIIPQQIHRFWSGGKMSEAAMGVLIDSANKTKGTTWQNNLWYSSTLEEKMDRAGFVSKHDQRIRKKQRKQLGKAGYNVRAIEEISQDDPKPGAEQSEIARGTITKGMLSSFTQSAVNTYMDGGTNRFDGIKFFSDHARLMYLDQIGGHHFDIDMGLGHMNLDRPYYHNDDEGLIPLMGAVAVSENEEISPLLRKLESREDRRMNGAEIREAGGIIAEKAAHAGAIVLNGMIASRPNNDYIKAALESLKKKFTVNEGNLGTGMGVQPILIYGPDELPEAEMRKKESLTVPPYLFDLQHLTDESENR